MQFVAHFNFISVVCVVVEEQSENESVMTFMEIMCTHGAIAFIHIVAYKIINLNILNRKLWIFWRARESIRSLLACQLMHSVEFSDYRNQWCSHSTTRTMHVYWNRYYQVLLSIQVSCNRDFPFFCCSHSTRKH